jgi:hypothetical protein
MLRSTAKPCVSKHEGVNTGTIHNRHPGGSRDPSFNQGDTQTIISSFPSWPGIDPLLSG